MDPDEPSRRTKEEAVKVEEEGWAMANFFLEEVAAPEDGPIRRGEFACLKDFQEPLQELVGLRVRILEVDGRSDAEHRRWRVQMQRNNKEVTVSEKNLRPCEDVLTYEWALTPGGRLGKGRAIKLVTLPAVGP